MLKKILFLGNGAQMNYIIVKKIRENFDFEPDLILLDYHHPIYDHPAWEDIKIKISQEIVISDFEKSLDIFKKSILENNWKMPNWIKEYPIKYSFFDKIKTKLFDMEYISKKHIDHYIKPVQNYDIVFTDGFAALSAQKASVQYIIRPYGSDILHQVFQKNSLGLKMQNAFQNSSAIFCHGYQNELKKLSLEQKHVMATAVIDTDAMCPNPQKISQKTSFFIASRLDLKLKGTDKALRAFAKLVKKYDATLYCIEFGKDVSLVKNIINNLGISEHVIFYDFVASKPVLAELYNSHDCIIGNLILGHVGTTELEALSCDKPVIAFVEPENEFEHKLPIMNSPTEEKIYENMKKICENNIVTKDMRKFVEKYCGIDYFVNHLKPFLE